MAETGLKRNWGQNMVMNRRVMACFVLIVGVWVGCVRAQPQSGTQLASQEMDEDETTKSLTAGISQLEEFFGELSKMRTESTKIDDHYQASVRAIEVGLQNLNAFVKKIIVAKPGSRALLLEGMRQQAEATRVEIDYLMTYLDVMGSEGKRVKLSATRDAMLAAIKVVEDQIVFLKP